MDLTASRWGLNGAEAILKLRALRSNGDLLEAPPRPRRLPGPRGALRQRNVTQSCLVTRHSHGAAPKLYSRQRSYARTV